MPEHADLLLGLHGLRTDGPGISEIVLACALGLLLAMIVGATLRTITRRASTNSNSQRARVAAVRAMPDAEKVVALANILRDLTERRAPGPEPWLVRAERAFRLPADIHSALEDSLYLPGGGPAPDALERLVGRIVAADRG